jgi:hypothetical protein
MSSRRWSRPSRRCSAHQPSNDTRRASARRSFSRARLRLRARKARLAVGPRPTARVLDPPDLRERTLLDGQEDLGLCAPQAARWRAIDRSRSSSREISCPLPPPAHPQEFTSATAHPPSRREFLRGESVLTWRQSYLRYRDAKPSSFWLVWIEPDQTRVERTRIIIRRSFPCVLLLCASWRSS